MAILGGIARKSSQLPEHLRMKPEGGVVTTQAGIAFVECVTVALPTEHISPELSPGIYIYSISSKMEYVVYTLTYSIFYIAPYSLIFSRNKASVARQ